MSDFKHESNFTQKSEIRDFLIKFQNEQQPNDQVWLDDYDAEARKLLVTRIDNILSESENEQELWVAFPDPVQEYINNCFDAFDEKKDALEFPDLEDVAPEKEIVVEEVVAEKVSEKEVVTEEVSEEAPEKEVVAKEVLKKSPKKVKKGRKKLKNSPVPKEVLEGFAKNLKVGARYYQEEIEFLCIVETETNFILRNAIGDLLFLERSKHKQNACMIDGRSKINRWATSILLDNPDMDLKTVTEEITVTRGLDISPEAIRVRFLILDEIKKHNEDKD